DVVASDSHYGEMLRRWQAVHRLGQLFGQPSEGRLDFKHKTKLGELPVAIRFEPFSDAIRDGLGIRVFDELVPSIEVHNGIPTLPIVSLVHSKLTRGSQKDVAGVIKGHIIAYGTDHPVARDQKWQRYVKAAVNEAVHWSKYPGWGKECRKLPGWLGSLIIGNFDHPAFRFSAQSQLRAA
ncbi:hypothetical protein IRY61_05545, partial [Candidatus Saccharibacteria bacterium]|nr:hypothetical protein [Candidatus Saccharibacteria bacterium]